MAGIRDNLEGRLLMQAMASGLPPSLPVFLRLNLSSWSFNSGRQPEVMQMLASRLQPERPLPQE